MEIKANVGLHNKFVIEVRDAETGELKQTATSYNIILDQMYTRLCGGSTYFVNIHFGTGTGTLSPSRTSLFTHLGTKAAVDEEQVKGIPNSSWTRKIVINPEEFVGSTFREVGIAFGATATNLVTHSLLRDSEGTPLEITKTATDVLTIYATVYVTLDTSNPKLRYAGVPDSNTLLNYLIGGAAFPTNAVMRLQEALFGTPSLGDSTALTFTSNTSLKRRISNTYRFPTTANNGHIKFLEVSGMFSLELPLSGAYEGSTYAGVQLGVGDGVTTDFGLPSLNIRSGSESFRLNGVLNSANILQNTTGIFDAQFSLPAAGFTTSNLRINGDGTLLFVNGPSRVRVLSRVSDVFEPAEDIVFSNSLSTFAINELGTRVFAVSNTRPYFHIADKVEGVWVVQEVTLPGGYPTSGCQFSRAQMSLNGLSIAVGCNLAPNFVIWDFVSNAWVARSSPISFMSSFATTSVMTRNFNAGGFFRHAGATITVMTWNGTSWAAKGSSIADNEASFPPALSDDSNTLVHSASGNPFLRILKHNGSAWVAQSFNISLPQQWFVGAGMTPDGLLIFAYDRSSSPNHTMDFFDTTNNPVVRTLRRTLVTANDYQLELPSISTDGNVVAYPRGVLLRRNRRVVKFTTPPAAGVVVTADYTVDGIHKTDQYVVDASFAIQFGEG